MSSRSSFTTPAWVSLRTRKNPSTKTSGQLSRTNTGRSMRLKSVEFSAWSEALLLFSHVSPHSLFSLCNFPPKKNHTCFSWWWQIFVPHIRKWKVRRGFFNTVNKLTVFFCIVYNKHLFDLETGWLIFILTYWLLLTLSWGASSTDSRRIFELILSEIQSWKFYILNTNFTSFSTGQKT